MTLEGKTAFVTGSARGIGFAVTELFAKNGANVFAHARKPSDEFEENLRTLSQKYSVKVVPVYFDMTDYDRMKAELGVLVKQKHNIDILVNNAGIAHGGFFQMTSLETVKEVFEINFFAIIKLSQIITRVMVKQKSGVIINMASLSALEPAAGNCAYGASKAAVIALTKTMAAELAPLGIRVNAVAPGLTDTSMAKQMESVAGETLVRTTFLQRLARPEEIANAVLFLAGGESSFVTGTVLSVDGGRV